MTHLKTRHTMTIETGALGVAEPYYEISVTDPKSRCWAPGCSTDNDPGRYHVRLIAHNDPTDIAFSIQWKQGGYEAYWGDDTW